MDKIKNSFLTILIITFCIFYLYNKPLAEVLRVLSPILMISVGVAAIYFGVTIIRNSKPLAADEVERFGKSSFQRNLSLQYREKPVRLTIKVAGICIIGFGLLFLIFASSRDSNDAFEGFRRIVLISAILTVASSGFTAIIAALFMLKRR